MRFIIKIVFVVIVLLIITACNQNNGTKPDNTQKILTSTNEAALSYPSPGSDKSSSAYPVPQNGTKTDNGGYPPPLNPTIESKPYQSEIVPFRINKPLKAGMTEVTGTGPIGVPIVLSDITFSGEEISNTVIQSNGTFVFEIPPLTAQHWLGIKLGNLDGMEWNAQTFNDQQFMGSEPKLVPQDSFYHDTVLVEK